MKATDKHNERMANITFATVYPLYVEKVQRKGRTLDELRQVIEWLTGFVPNDLQKLMEENVRFKTFFERATLNPKAELIKGTICGYRIEEIDNPLTKNVRCLDKLIDELAQGKKLDRILSQ